MLTILFRCEYNTAMTYKQLYEHFKPKDQSELAKIVGVTQSTISKWTKSIPEGQQYKIQLQTGGALKAEANAN